MTIIADLAHAASVNNLAAKPRTKWVMGESAWRALNSTCPEIFEDHPLVLYGMPIERTEDFPGWELL